MTAVGRVLRQDDRSDSLTAEQFQILQNLWLDRRAAVDAGESDVTRELAAFAWWSGAPDIDPRWWIEQIRFILGRGVEPEPEFLVIEALPAAAVMEPDTTIRVLRSLLDVLTSP